MALPDYLQFNTDQLPTMPPVASQMRGNWLTSGLKAGGNELLGLGGSAVQALGTAVGAPGVAQWGSRVAADRTQAAQTAGRPDLEIAPWEAGGASPLPWLGYQAAKQIPSLAAMVAGGMLVPEAAVPAALGRLGAVVPRVLGGGAGLEAEAAATAGQEFAKHVTGATIVGYPMGVGALTDAAKQDGDLTRGEAAGALVGGAPWAAVGGLMPTQLRSIAEKGAAGGLAQRLMTGAATAGAVAGPQMAVQTAIQQQFEPPKSLEDKAHEIVNAALTGSITGAAFGGALSLRAMKSAKPADLSNDALGGAVDQAVTAPQLALPAPEKRLAIGQEALTPEPPAVPPTEGSPRTEAPGPDDATMQLAGSVYRRLQSGEQVTPAMEKVARYFGLLDEQGKPVTSDGLIAARQDALQQVEQARRTLDPEGMQAAQQRLADVSAKGAFLDQITAPEAQGQGRLFTADQTPPAPAAAQEAMQTRGMTEDAARQQMRDLAAQIGGRPTQFTRSLNVKTEADLSKAVFDKLAAGQGGKTLDALGRHFGLLDKDGQLVEPRSSTEEPARELEQQNLDLTFASPQQTESPATTRQWVKDVAGPRARTSTAASRAELTAHVVDQIAGGRPSETVKDLGARLGLLDDAGKPVALDDALSKASADLDQAKKTEIATPSDVTSAAVRDAQDKVDLLQAAQTHIAGREAVKQAATESAQAQAAHAQARADAFAKVPEPLQDHWKALDAIHASAQTPDAMKDRAATAQAKLESGANGGKQAAARVLKDYADALRARSTTAVDMGATRARDALGSNIEPDAAVAAREELGSNIEPDAAVAAREELGRNIPEQSEAVQATQPDVRAANDERLQALRAQHAQEEAQALQREELRRAGAVRKNLPSRQAELRGRLKASDASKFAAGFKKWREAQAQIEPKIETKIETKIEPKIEPVADATQIAPEAPKSPEAEPPTWATEHLPDVRGEVVYHSPDVALVRAQARLTGKGVYVAVDRATGSRTRVDIDSYTGKLFTPEQRQELSDAKAQIEATDRLKAQTTPDGPFTSADKNVVATAGVDPAYRNYLTHVMDKLGLGGVRVLLLHPEDLVGNREQYKLNGDYHSAMSAGMSAHEDGSLRQFGPSAKDFYISVRPGMSEARTVETISHELGHLVERVAYTQAAPETQKAVRAEFETWLKSTKTMTAPEIVQSLRNRETGVAQSEGVPNDARLTPYWTSFPEWFADNVSKWATTAETPVGVVERFFSGLAKHLRKLAATVMGEKYAPARTVAEFLDSMGPGSASTWMEAKEAKPAPLSKLETPPKTVAESGDAVEKFAGRTTQVRDQVFKGLADAGVGPEQLKADVRGVLNLWRTASGLRDWYQHLIPSSDAYVTNRQYRSVVKDRIGGTHSEVLTAAQTFKQQGAKQAKLMDRVLEYTASGIAPGKNWEQHTWLHDQPNAAAYRAQVVEAAKDMATLRQLGGGKAYDALAMSNRMDLVSRWSAFLHNYVATLGQDAPVRGFEKAPGKTYQFDTNAQASVQGAHDFWDKTLKQQLSDAQAHVDATMGAAALESDAVKQGRTKSGVSPLIDLINDIRSSVQAADQAPNFHLGRFGDYFVSGHLVADPKGQIDARKLELLSTRLNAAGFGDVGLNQFADKSSLFMRVDNADNMARLHQVILKAQADGLLSKDQAVARGGVDDMSTLKGAMPVYMQKMLESVRASKAFGSEEGEGPHANVMRTARAQLLTELQRQYMNLLPEASVKKVLQQRGNISGYTTDMLRNFAQRSHVTANAVSNLTFTHDIDAAMMGMRNEARDLRTSGKSTSELLAAHQAVAEFAKREAERPWATPNSFISKARAFNHTFYLGASPAYVLEQLSQIPQLLWPELAKTNGYMKSATAIARVTPEAFKILRASMSGDHGSEFHVTPEILRKAGVSPRTIEFMMTVANRGGLDLGGFSREVGSMARGDLDSRTAKMMRWANATAVGSETLSRLITALATRDLHGDQPGLYEKVSHVMDQAMFTWGAENNPRAVGSRGVLGTASPLIETFTGYHSRLLEKLYREFGTALGRNGTEQQRAEARRFLAGHVAATTAIAGTLGAPALGAILGGVTKLANTLTGSDQFDLEASYRNWLTDVFGQGVGEVIAKGLPRAAGIDMSHLGEQNVLPFTGLLTDRRKLEDAWPDWLESSTGTIVSMGYHDALAARDFVNGNYLQAMQRFAPGGLRGPVEALRTALHGYENNQGVKLPITASGADILKQALGLTPENKALDSEAAKTLAGQKADRQFYSANIMKNLAISIERQDAPEIKKWVGEAREFDAGHPTYMILPRLGAELQKRAVEAETARAMGMPLGASIKDVSQRAKVRFSNPANQ